MRDWLAKMHLCDRLFIIALIIAFAHTVTTTADLNWGYSPDLYRDTGAAQSILDGTYPDDPLYLGEKQWYNPLIPALVAAISTMSTEPLHVFYVRAGAYLNLLTPIAFYVMCILFFERRVALAAAVGHIFILADGDRNTYTATYDAWLFTVNVMQAFFFALVAIFLHARRTDQLRWYTVIGIVLGLTFLGHTAPALIFGLIFGLVMAVDLIRSWDSTLDAPDVYRISLRIGVVVGLAVIVSLPLLTIVLGHYQLKTLNDIPATYRSVLLIDNIGLFIRQQLTPVSIIAAIGLVSVYKWPHRQHARQLLLLWFGITAVMVGYDYVVQAFGRIQVELPTIIPSWHFVIYLEALKAVLFGYGLLMCARFSVGMVQYLTSERIISERHDKRAIQLVFIIFLLLGVALSYPTYRNRDEFTFARDESLFVDRVMADRINAYHWVRTQTEPNTVFLASDDHLKMFVVAQAGRKLTVAPRTFSNPYVAWEPRNAESDGMINALIQGDEPMFHELATPYNLDYVIVSGDVRLQVMPAELSFIEMVFDEGDVTIYRYILGPDG